MFNHPSFLELLRVVSGFPRSKPLGFWPQLFSLQNGCLLCYPTNSINALKAAVVKKIFEIGK